MSGGNVTAERGAAHLTPTEPEYWGFTVGKRAVRTVEWTPSAAMRRFAAWVLAFVIAKVNVVVVSETRWLNLAL